jgi:hypothetical protein
MKKLLCVALLVITFMLAGCDEDTTVVVAPVQVVNYTPELRYFDMVDSYGVDTAKPGNTPLTLDPYLYNGLFDVSWSVNSLEDYRVNIRINDGTGVSNSVLVYSEICGLNRACDQSGAVICEYTSDQYLSCNNSNRPTDIRLLFRSIPQDLYFMLEVCDLDSSYCDYLYYPVRMQ